MPKPNFLQKYNFPKSSTHESVDVCTNRYTNNPIRKQETKSEECDDLLLCKSYSMSETIRDANIASTNFMTWINIFLRKYISI